MVVVQWTSRLFPWRHLLWSSSHNLAGEPLRLVLQTSYLKVLATAPSRAEVIQLCCSSPKSHPCHHPSSFPTQPGSHRAAVTRGNAESSSTFPQNCPHPTYLMRRATWNKLWDKLQLRAEDQHTVHTPAKTSDTLTVKTEVGPKSGADSAVCTAQRMTHPVICLTL